MLHGYIDIPTIYFFEEKNIWTGSVFDNFNYRIMPVKTDEKSELYSVIWYGKKCFDLVDNSEYAYEFHEEFSAEGLDILTEKINSAVEQYKKSQVG